MEEKKCMKCGRPCAENQAFCAECLTDMERHPVKPGVVVLLPQQERAARPVSRRRQSVLSPEEQLARLKKQVISLWLALILALGAAGTLGWFLFKDHMSHEAAKPLPGQNYSSEETKLPEETP